MTDRPASEFDEIEITPEMIEAGSDVLYSLNDDLMGAVPIETASRLAVGVFEAMFRQSSQLIGGISASCSGPTDANRHEEPCVSDEH